MRSVIFFSTSRCPWGHLADAKGRALPAEFVAALKLKPMKAKILLGRVQKA